MEAAMGEYISLYVICAHRDEATVIAQALVGEELVACVNIMPEVQSLYRWRGAVEQATECAFIAKTRRELGDRAVARINVLHSYETPCIVIWPITGGYSPYLDWITANTRQD